MQLFTARLAMRPLQSSDWPLFLQLHQNPTVIRYCYDMPSEAFVRSRFEQRLKSWDITSTHPLCLVVFDKQSNEPMGVTGFTYELEQAELGYLFLPAYYNQGFASESLRAVIEWAWQQCGITQFKAVVTKGNIGSEKVLQKCGLTLTGINTQAHTINNTRYDDLIYTLKL